MDQRPTEERKRQLSATLAASRARIQLGQSKLREDLNPVRRLRNAVRRKPVKTFAIAAGAAFLVGLLRHRPGRSHRKRGFKRLLLRGGFRIAQPALRFWLLKLAKERFLDPQSLKAPEIHRHNS